MRRKLLWALAVLVVLFIVIQFVPYGHSHRNPPTLASPTWNSARTATLLRGACYDCHSNQTHWPWYSSIAPASWLLYRDVSHGRARLNFSDWRVAPGAGPNWAQDIATRVDNGSMPPLRYRLLHSAARLSKADKAALIAGVRASLR